MADRRDEEPSFANLIGATKPIKGRGNVLPPVAGRRVNRERPDIASPESPGFRRPDPDEPRLGAAPGVSDRQLDQLKRGDPEPQERIDLHGLRSDAAPRLLAQRLESATHRGLRCVLVIHGRGAESAAGEAVLRERLPHWLTQPPIARDVRAFAPAPPRLGGAGAMLVLLRRSARRA